MYGLVNMGVRDMVVDAGGEELWTLVRTRAGLEDDDFRGMQSYDDSVTLGLVSAASETLNTPADVLLRGFGYHWISFTARE
ncbi:MAG: heme NO-binding domain-containing protein, partial [Pseudomonadota bacterium]